jgi:hypothetical protein
MLIYPKYVQQIQNLPVLFQTFDSFCTLLFNVCGFLNKDK